MAAALDIHPHSRRISGYAVAGLMLLAAGSFTAGFAHQIVLRAAPSPFPRGESGGQAYAAIPNATPAPELQVATAPPAPPRKAPPDLTALVGDIPPVAATAETAPAVDAAATAPEPAAPPEPRPAEDPPTP